MHYHSITKSSDFSAEISQFFRNTEFSNDTHCVNFKNSYGRGNIQRRNILPGVTLTTFDLELEKEIIVQNKWIAKADLNFISILEGYLFFRSEDEGVAYKMNYQRVIKQQTNNDIKRFIFPLFLPLKFTVVSIAIEQFKDYLPQNEEDLKRQLIWIRNEVSEKTNILGSTNFDLDRISIYLILKEIFANDSKDYIKTITLQALILNLIAIYLNYYQNRNNKKTPQKEVDILLESDLNEFIEVVCYIHAHLSEQITVKEICDQFNINKNKLNLIFKKIVGQTTGEFIINARIEKARILLEQADLSISEICYDIGLSSRSYFSVIFREQLGCHPSEYRKLYSNRNTVYELSYAMQIDSTLSLTDYDQLIIRIKRINEDFDISGVLVYEKDFILHILEGNYKELERLYGRLIKDNPAVKFYSAGYRKQKRFKSWQVFKIRTIAKNSSKLEYKSLRDIVQSKYEKFSTAVFWQVFQHLNVSGFLEQKI